MNEISITTHTVKVSFHSDRNANFSSDFKCGGANEMKFTANVIYNDSHYSALAETEEVRSLNFSFLFSSLGIWFRTTFFFCDWFVRQI